MSDTSRDRERIASEYWSEGADGSAVLFASQCSGCGTLFLPKVMICSECGGADFERSPLPDIGHLYSFTVIHSAPPGYASPYAVGYVDFPEGVRVFGHVRLDGVPTPTFDCAVAVEAADLFTRADGGHVRGYRFVPLETRGEPR